MNAYIALRSSSYSPVNCGAPSLIVQKAIKQGSINKRFERYLHPETADSTRLF
jgi:hypothetical protein